MITKFHERIRCNKIYNINNKFSCICQFGEKGRILICGKSEIDFGNESKLFLTNHM